MTSPLKGKFITGLSKQITSDNSPFKTCTWCNQMGNVYGCYRHSRW